MEKRPGHIAGRMAGWVCAEVQTLPDLAGGKGVKTVTLHQDKVNTAETAAQAAGF